MIYLKIPAGHHLFQIWNKTFKSQYLGSVTWVDRLVSLTLLDMLLTVLVPIPFTSRTAQACKNICLCTRGDTEIVLSKNYGNKVLFVNLKRYEEEHIHINLPCFRGVFNIIVFHCVYFVFYC